MTGKSNRVAALDTEYAKKKYAEFQQQQRQLIFQRHRLAAIFIGALVISTIIGVQIFHDIQRMHQLDKSRIGANTEMKEINVGIGQLHQGVSLLKGDEYVAKLARSKFFYSKDGEKIYPILESNTDSSTNETDQSTGSTTAK